MQSTNGAYEESWTFVGTTFVRNADIRRITNQPPVLSITKSRRLTFFGHSARMDENACASQARTAHRLPRVTEFNAC